MYFSSTPVSDANCSFRSLTSACAGNDKPNLTYKISEKENVTTKNVTKIVTKTKNILKFNVS